MANSASGEQMAQRPSFSFFLLVAFFLLFVPVSADLQSPTQTPAPYTIKLFIPSPGMLHSNQITDLINGHDHDVLIATSYGLSIYNGSWSTRHKNIDNISEGLMDDYITALEFDGDGNLWIGYSGGIQVYNGIYYQVNRDQQLLKDPNIQDLQHWDNDMWVATGHAGIQRYRNGTWTWFQPGSRNGPGFYEVTSMTLDRATDSLLIATRDEGLWMVRSPDDPVRFETISDKGSVYDLLDRVRQNPHGPGGVYFFNSSRVVYFSQERGFIPVLSSSDLTITDTNINDLAAGADGKLYLATDDGIYVWENGQVTLHLSRFEGIGTSAVVKSVHVDAENRVWFSTTDDVGYYQDSSSPVTSLAIENVTVPQTTDSADQHADVIPTISENNVTPAGTTLSGADESGNGVSSLIDPLIKAIRSILSGIGLH